MTTLRHDLANALSGVPGDDRPTVERLASVAERHIATARADERERAAQAVQAARRDLSTPLTREERDGLLMAVEIIRGGVL